MKGWAPLWSGIVESSIWDEPDHVRIVFVTMLAMKDPDHVVRMTAYNIARASRKTETEVLEALKILMSPDTKRVEPQPFEGRRIEKVPDGYLILNGEYYRQMVSKEMTRIRNLRSQRAFREREAKKEAALRSAPVEKPPENGVAEDPNVIPTANPTHPPAGSPRHAGDAQAIGDLIGVPPEFAVKVYHRLVESGWKDETKGPIKNFRLYLKSAWENERQKPTKKPPESTEIQEQIKVPHL